MAGLRLDRLCPRLLEPIDLVIEAGGLVFLSGPSGAGKSLLLRAIADLDPHAGEAWVDDSARSSLSAADWRTRVGLLPAEPHWWAERVGEHFHLPWRPDASMPDVARLAALGFEPDVMEWLVARLSTGERQRLALARMLAVDPEVLLLDEPTANLDPTNRTRVEELIDRYRVERAAATFWVSHDPEQRARLPGVRLVIAGAKLVAETWT